MRGTKHPSGGTASYGAGTPQPAREGLAQWIRARKGKIGIAVVLIGGLAFAAGWNPPTETVHTFTSASDYSARRESGCTNSGDGCHGFDEGLSDFNKYHPDTACTVCHDYTGVGCIPCHAPNQHECTGCHDGSMEGVSDCVTLADAWPKGHYRESLHTALGTDFEQVVRTAADGEAKATCADCHSRDLKTAHSVVNEVDGGDYGTEIGCVECHNDEQSGALDQVLSDWEDHRCEDCHQETVRAPMHASDVISGSVEASGTASCGTTGAGCHDGNDLHALHPDKPATCSGSAAEGEPACHDFEAEPKTPVVTACGTGEGNCHPDYLNDEYSHTDDDVVHAPESRSQASATYTDRTSGVSVTCGSCHTTDIGIEHARRNSVIAGDTCLGCHNKNETTVAAVMGDWPASDTAAACATCHGDSIHGAIGSAHVATQIDHEGHVSSTGCAKPGCHPTADVRVLHAEIGCTISGCHSNTGDIRGSRTMTCGGTDDQSGTSCHTASSRHATADAAHIATQIGHDGQVSETGCVRPGCHATADVRDLHEEVGVCYTAGCHVAGGPTYMTCGGGAGTPACHTASDANKHDDFATVHVGVEYSTANVPTPGSCVKDGCHVTVNVYETHHEVGCAIPGCHVEGGPTGVLGCGGNADNAALSCHLRNISYHTKNPNHHIGVEYSTANVPTPGSCVKDGCHTTTRLSTLHSGVGGCYGTPGCHVAGGPSMIIGCGGNDPTLSCHMATADPPDTYHPDSATVHTGVEIGNDGLPQEGACGCHDNPSPPPGYSALDVRSIPDPTPDTPTTVDAHACTEAGCHTVGGHLTVSCGGTDGSVANCHSTAASRSASCVIPAGPVPTLSASIAANTPPDTQAGSAVSTEISGTAAPVLSDATQSDDTEQPSTSPACSADSSPVPEPSICLSCHTLAP